MANNWTLHRKIDLSKPSRDMAFDAGYLYRNDNQAHVWEVEVTRDGAAASLSGYGARGYFIRPDGSTIAVAGSVSGNTARVTLNNSCYAQRGVLKGALRLEKTGEVITISAMVARVDLASTENIVINTETEPDVTALLAELDAAIEAAQDIIDDVGGAIENKAVIYTGAQSLTDAQKATARGNIGAASIEIEGSALVIDCESGGDNFYNQWAWSSTAGGPAKLTRLQYPVNQVSQADGHYTIVIWDNSTRNDRRGFAVLRGVTPMKDAVGEDTEYYPVPIPVGATKAKAVLSDQSQYLSIYAMKPVGNGEYDMIAPASVSWHQGTDELEFAAGEGLVLFFNCKYNSSGSAYPSGIEPDVTLTFE